MEKTMGLLQDLRRRELEINKNYYLYYLYGFKVKSQIKLPEAIEVDEKKDTNSNYKYDIFIGYTNVSEDITRKINEGTKIECSKEKIWFSIEGVAIYEVYNGNEILVQVNGGNDQDVKAFLLGSAFGFLLIERNVVAVHGGTIVINDEAMIITGDMGAGKSTLTSAFRTRGYDFLADDVSVVKMNRDNIPMVQPAYPQQKLCRDAALKLGLDVSKLVNINEERDKFAVPLKDKFVFNEKQLKYIVEITIDENDSNNGNVVIEEIQGINKIDYIIKNIYRIQITERIGMKDEYFSNIIKICSQIKYYRVVRPKNAFTVDKQIDLIKTQIGA